MILSKQRYSNLTLSIIVIATLLGILASQAVAASYLDNTRYLGGSGGWEVLGDSVSSDWIYLGYPTPASPAALETPTETISVSLTALFGILILIVLLTLILRIEAGDNPITTILIALIIGAIGILGYGILAGLT